MNKIEYWFFMILSIIIFKVEFDKPYKHNQYNVWPYSIRERFIIRIILFFAKPFLEEGELLLPDNIKPSKIDRYKYDMVGYYE